MPPHATSMSPPLSFAQASASAHGLSPIRMGARFFFKDARSSHHRRLPVPSAQDTPTGGIRMVRFRPRLAIAASAAMVVFIGAAAAQSVGIVEKKVFAMPSYSTPAGPESIDPDTGKPAGTSMTIVTAGDFVTAPVAPLGTLGVGAVQAEIRAAMGGLQALDWAAACPGAVGRAGPELGIGEMNAF